MPIGIPDRNINTSIPEANLEIWDYVIHEHKADVAGLHYDLRLSPTGSNIAYSWAIPKARMPIPGEKILAVKQPDHTREYMSWHGEIADGYGKGKVTIADKGQVEVLESSNNKITFNIYTGVESRRYNLIKVNANNWILLNWTPTKEKRKIPDYKPKYKDVPFKKVIYGKSDEIFSPKFDGAHALFQLRKDHGIDIFSYRPSKRSSTKLIDHTFKTDLHKVKPPIGNTILRGELFARDKNGKVLPSVTTGGTLNAGVWNSRIKQEKEGKLDHVVYDIVMYKGKNVENVPYSDKLEMLKAINLNVPELKLPPLAYNIITKQKLLNDIELGNNLDTDEGIIIYNLNEAIPKRAKIKHDFDVYVTSVFPGLGKYKGKAAGGFTYSLSPSGPTVGKVGSGFTDKERIEMWQNSNKYIGRVAKVITERKYHTGSLRVPIFKEWRYEKYAENKGKYFKRQIYNMKVYRNGKYIGQSPIFKIYSNKPVNVGKWTDTLHTRGHRKGYLL